MEGDVVVKSSSTSFQRMPVCENVVDVSNNGEDTIIAKDRHEKINDIVTVINGCLANYVWTEVMKC
jgi:hypothetical protein